MGIGCLVLLSATGAPWWLVLYVAFYGMAQGSSGIVASARAADLTPVGPLALPVIRAQRYQAPSNYERVATHIPVSASNP